jgi:hypothetical protein
MESSQSPNESIRRVAVLGAGVMGSAMALARHWDIPDQTLTTAITGSPLVSPCAAAKLTKMVADGAGPLDVSAARLEPVSVGPAGRRRLRTEGGPGGSAPPRGRGTTR